ncbi:MAG: hypothetical protein ACJ75P_11745 [Gaiellaceae bacterium]
MKNLRTSSKTALRVAAALAVACVFLGGAGTGAADDVTNPSPCPSPDKAKRFCVTVSDTDGVSRTLGAAPFYMEYVVTVRSTEKSRSLTHPTFKATLVDLFANDVTAPTTAILKRTTIDSTTTCTGLAADGTISCNLPKLTPGAVWVARFLMTTATNANALATRLTARVSVDERESDSLDPKDPNQEVREAANPTLYAAGNSAGTIVPDGLEGDRHFSLPTSLSSLEFESDGSLAFSAFITDFADDKGRCFSSVPCLAQTSQSTVGGGSLFGATNPIQWIRQIVNPPGSVKYYNIEAIHRYDGVAVTANAATNTFSTPKTFVNIDGVRLTSTGNVPAPLKAGTDYFVVSETATSFQVAKTENGNPIDLTNAGTGTITAERIRVIGDTADERASSCLETLTKVPSIYGELNSTGILECVSDTENGFMK